MIPFGDLPGAVLAALGGARVLHRDRGFLRAPGVSTLGPHELFLAEDNRLLIRDTGAFQGLAEELHQLDLDLSDPASTRVVVLPGARTRRLPPAYLHLYLRRPPGILLQASFLENVEDAARVLGGIPAGSFAQAPFFTRLRLAVADSPRVDAAYGRVRLDGDTLVLEHSTPLDELHSSLDHLDHLAELPLTTHRVRLDQLRRLTRESPGRLETWTRQFVEDPRVPLTRLPLALSLLWEERHYRAVELLLPPALAAELTARIEVEPAARGELLKPFPKRVESLPGR